MPRHLRLCTSTRRAKRCEPTPWRVPPNPAHQMTYKCQIIIVRKCNLSHFLRQLFNTVNSAALVCLQPDGCAFCQVIRCLLLVCGAFVGQPHWCFFLFYSLILLVFDLMSSTCHEYVDSLFFFYTYWRCSFFFLSMMPLRLMTGCRVHTWSCALSGCICNCCPRCTDVVVACNIRTWYPCVCTSCSWWWCSWWWWVTFRS